MTRTEHLLFILAEECTEVAQRCSKAARFTLDERQAENKLATELTRESKYSNGERISLELTHIFAVAEILVLSGVIPDFGQTEQTLSKKIKVEEFLGYSEKVGTLEP